jgi:hypothetical protein
MTAALAPLFATKRPVVSEVRRVVNKVLKDDLFPIGKGSYIREKSVMDFADDLLLVALDFSQQELITDRISDELFCARPTPEIRAQWNGYSDLYIYYLSHARAL